MRPHPILILLSDAKPFGGAEHSVADLVRRLDRSLFSVRVVVPRESSSVERFRAARVTWCASRASLLCSTNIA
jgi:hypothetical protein